MLVLGPFDGQCPPYGRRFIRLIAARRWASYDNPTAALIVPPALPGLGTPAMTSASSLGCANFRQTLALNRRGLLKVGALGASGLTLSNLLRAERIAAAAGQPVKKDT